VPDQVAAVLPQLDGQHTIAELEQREHARAISHLLRALQGMGALQSS
jgi:hypothetical protein